MRYFTPVTYAVKSAQRRAHVHVVAYRRFLYSLALYNTGVDDGALLNAVHDSYKKRLIGFATGALVVESISELGAVVRSSLWPWQKVGQLTLYAHGFPGGMNIGTDQLDWETFYIFCTSLVSSLKGRVSDDFILDLSGCLAGAEKDFLRALAMQLSDDLGVSATVSGPIGLELNVFPKKLGNWQVCTAGKCWVEPHGNEIEPVRNLIFGTIAAGIGFITPGK